MILIFQLTAVGLLSITLAVSYTMSGHLGLALICLMLGLAWAAVDWFGVGRTINKPNSQTGVSKKMRRGGDPFIDNLGMLFFTGLAGWGLWQGLPAWLMLVEVLLTLAAWDLGRFSNRLLAVINEVAAARLERIHLSRLGAVLAAGLLLGGIPLLVHIPLDFGWIMVLGVLAIIALNRFARGLSR